jgi:hypothetical protein
MTSQKGKRHADYSVGYGRPPKAKQFAPGQSGNPKGRPEGSRTIGTILQGIIWQKITVTEGGKTRRISALDVALRRLVDDAMRGDSKALKHLLPLVEQYAQSRDAGLQLEELLPEDKAILAHYLQKSIDLPSDSASEGVEKAGDGKAN